MLLEQGLDCVLEKLEYLELGGKQGFWGDGGCADVVFGDLCAETG